MLNNLYAGANQAWRWVVFKAPTLYTIGGIAGFGLTSVLCITETANAVKAIDIKKQEKGEDLTFKEKVGIVAPLYLTPLVAFGLSSASVAMSNVENNKRLAGYAMLLASERENSKILKKKLADELGKKKEAKINEEVQKDIGKESLKSAEIDEATDGGTTWFLDPKSGKKFTSSVERIHKVESLLNKRLVSEMWISLNDLYYELGLRPCECIGDYFGWNSGESVDISFTAIVDEDDIPVLVMDYNIYERFDYTCTSRFY